MGSGKILDIEQLLELYKKGFFPMAENAISKEVNFYKPKKRFIIPINKFHIPRKLFSEFQKNKFKITINNNFLKVINSCKNIIRKENGTWINEVILETFYKLFDAGYAKSIECYYENKLIGGLYGIHIGGCFFGESMFNNKTNGSKICLLYLISILKKNNFDLLDSQFYNPHLLQFGAYEIKDEKYQKILEQGVKKKCSFPKKFEFHESLSVLQLLIHKS